MNMGFVYAWGAYDQIVGWESHSMMECGDAVIVDVVSTHKAFALLSSTGRVYVIGTAGFGGRIPIDYINVGILFPPFLARPMLYFMSLTLLKALSGDVVQIVASQGSFTALKRDGSVYTWGSRHTGKFYFLLGYFLCRHFFPLWVRP